MELALGGHPSSTQGVLIVPEPGSTDDQLFYVFTVSAEAGDYTPLHTGLEYVIVDMSLNEGLGDVSEETVELVPNTGEKLHATWHSNKRDVWVVTHSMESNEYHSFLVTCNGIEDHVVSATGVVHDFTAYGEGCIGNMKLSPNGERVACVYNGQGSTAQQLVSYLEVGTFDASTGEVVITDGVVKSNEDTVHGYSVEFSPDNSKLYWSRPSVTVSLYQYDLTQPSLAQGEYAFEALSEYPHSFTALQLAPNGKIYIARSHDGTRLSVFENPNEVGPLSGFSEIGVEISQLCRFGLPNQWMFPYPDPGHEINTEELSLCAGSQLRLNAPSALGENYLWNTGQTNSAITVDEVGEYWVTATKCVQDTTFYHLELQEFCICDLFVPNSFTPDRDGLNDEFGATSWCEYDDYSFTVFDRWGTIVFSSSDSSKKWDGTIKGFECPSGIYVWKAYWKDPYAEESEAEHYDFGHVNLMK